MSQGRAPFGLLGLGGLAIVVAVVGLVVGSRSSGRERPRSGTAAAVAGGLASGGLRGAGVVVGGGVVGGGSGGPTGRTGGLVGASTVGAARSGPGGTDSEIQADPEEMDPGLRREHDRLLVERPVFQHVPYRDREIGVDFDRVVGGGRLDLLVTYLGSRERAVEDFRRLLARYGDPGTGYVETYKRVF